MFEDKDSDAKDLLGASLVSGLPLLEQLTGKEMAPGCSEFRRVTQERAGAEEGVAGPGSKGEEAGQEG